MASIERTAYPRFKRPPSTRELALVYTPTAEERAFVETHRTRREPTLDVGGAAQSPSSISATSRR